MNALPGKVSRRFRVFIPLLLAVGGGILWSSVIMATAPQHKPGPGIAAHPTTRNLPRQVIEPHDFFFPFIPVDHHQPVQLRNYVRWQDRSHDEYIAGEVFNLSNTPVVSITITAAIYDADQHRIGTYTGTTLLEATFPNAPNPFLISWFPSDWGPGYALSIDTWRYEADPAYVPLTVVSKNKSGDNWVTTVYGEIRNDHDRPVHSPKVAVWTSNEGPYATPFWPRLAEVDAADMPPGGTVEYTTSFVHIWVVLPGIGECFVAAQGMIEPQPTTRR